MEAVIYKPSRNAMQSGFARTAYWVLEFDADIARGPESLMGWTASSGTQEQVRLRFPSLEEAQAYAESRGLNFIVKSVHERRIKPRNYTDNFRYVPADLAENS